MNINKKQIIERLMQFFGKEKLTDAQIALVNPAFIKKCGPQNSLSFKNERYIDTGDGYNVCLSVSRYPKNPKYNWLSELCVSDAITVFDIATDNPKTVEQNLNKSMDEQLARENTAKSKKEYMDAAQQSAELERMYDEVANSDAVMKLLLSRIYIPGRIKYVLESNIAGIVNNLEPSYKAGIALDEELADWRALFLPYKKQQETLYKKIGQPLLTDTLAGGNPFHFSSLSDPNGFFWGTTSVGSGGSIFLDVFNKTLTRLSYNIILSGIMGSGKSNALKNLLQDRAIRGDKIRVFDVTGEFRTLVEFYGGTVVSLDGQSNNIINALQILKSSDDDFTTYSAHISKVATIYKYLDPSASRNHLLILKRLLRKLYIEFGIVTKDGRIAKPLIEFKNTDYPLWHDLLTLIRRELEAISNSAPESEYAAPDDELPEDELSDDSSKGHVNKITHVSVTKKADILTDLELSINDICENYGNIFDAPTSLENIYDEQIVCFDIKSLLAMEPEVFDAQLFLALSLCWENCVSSGTTMKDLYDNDNIKFEDIQRFLVIIDEAHRIVNANKLTGVKQIELYMREARKYFGGLALASQSITDFFPENSSEKGISTIKNLFNFSTYKFMLRQDASAKETIRTAFAGTFTESEIESIPNLEQGEAVLSIAGDHNFTFHIDVSDESLSLFKGGA